MNLFERQTLVWGGIGFIAFTFIANSVKADTTVQDHYKNIIYKKNLGKIARNKSRVWIWSKYLNTLGAITDVWIMIIPHIIPEIINSKLNIM